MKQRLAVFLTLFVFWTLGVVRPSVAAPAPCKATSTFDEKTDSEEQKAIVQNALDAAAGTCVGSSGFTVGGIKCTPPPDYAVAVTVAGVPVPGAVNTSCTNDALTVTFDWSKLKGFATKEMTFTVNQAGNEKFKVAAKIPLERAADAPEANGEDPKKASEAAKAEPALTPRNATKRLLDSGDTLFETMAENPTCPANSKCIYLHENLAVDPISPLHITDSDRLIVRLVARKAVQCLYRVQSEPANETEREANKFGGGQSLGAVLKEAGIVLTSTKAAAPNPGIVKSCGEDVAVTPSGDFEIKEGTNGANYSVTEFVFGPYSNGTVKILASRYDRNLTKVQLEQVTIQVENRPRYMGWLDLGVFGLQVRGDKLHIDQENGSELQRIRVEDGRTDIDFAVLAKVFVVCSGEGNGAFQTQDIASAGFCLGLSGGFSLTDPTRRFFPFGLNATFGGKVSIHGLTVLERGQKLSGGLRDGDLFSGTVDDLTTTTELQLGYALGIGLDPSIVGDLFGAILKAF